MAHIGWDTETVNISVKFMSIMDGYPSFYVRDKMLYVKI